MSMADGLRYAKYPMDRRMSGLRENMPIYFIYGENTRMELNAAYRVQNYLKQNQVTVKVIERTAHHPYAERSEIFNKYVNSLMKLVDEDVNAKESLKEN
jgi:pimeloyl-ACP methyl ester carboxylesterase